LKRFFERGERAPPKLPLFVIAKFFYVKKSRFSSLFCMPTTGAHGGRSARQGVKPCRSKMRLKFTEEVSQIWVILGCPVGYGLFLDNLIQ
jgi:hypothetical protein